MRAAGLILLLSCAQAEAQPPAVCDHAELHAQLALLRADLARVQVEADENLVLTLVGGPRRRWNGGGVGCDGGMYAPGSWGEMAHRALMRSGYCEPAELPVAKRR